MTDTTVADYILDRLRAWGVAHVFAFPGDGINGIMEALRTRRDAIRFVQVRHEEAAAFMACAHAKFTGEVGEQLDDLPAPGGVERCGGSRTAGRLPVADLAGHTRGSAHAFGRVEAQQGATARAERAERRRRIVPVPAGQVGE